ncbi:MAG TPA: hypothetical protein VFT79_08240 [Solirubrobacterales bacterium]|nr:hypothetical protein [Solirubrobacterales bacterium]
MLSKGILRLVASGLIGLLVLLGGCGGGDETTSLTKAEFVKVANAVCKRHNEQREQKIAAAVAGFDQKTEELSAAEKEDLILEISAPYEKATAELKALDAPEGDQEKIGSIIKAMEEASQEVKENPKAAITTTSMYDKANKLIDDYGLTDCRR